MLAVVVAAIVLIALIVVAAAIHVLMNRGCPLMMNALKATRVRLERAGFSDVGSAGGE